MKYGTKPLLNRLDRLPEHRLELVRCCPARVAKVDLVVFSRHLVVMLGDEFVMHSVKSRPFIFVASDVQDLYAEALSVRFEPELAQR